MNARDYATKAHEGQTYGAEPYTVHLEAVVAIVRTVDDSPETEAVAWLHDAPEDCGDAEGSLRELHSRFGEAVAAPVALVTDPAGPNRRARKAALHDRLAELDPADPSHRRALLVKAGDRLANTRACVENHPGKLKMYRSEHADFRDAVYRPGVCDSIWAELDRLLA